MIIVKILWYHLVFSAINILLYEIIKELFAQRILNNKWDQTAAYKEYENSNSPEGYPKGYYSHYIHMLIPILNIALTCNLINMILHEPDESQF